MKITKFAHSCVLVETPEAAALFDPGEYSTYNLDDITRLDDIIITHVHGDHFDLGNVQKLHAKFPQVTITAPADIVHILANEGVPATSEPSERVALFDAPHEKLKPLMPVDPPLEIGAHWLGLVSHPGDSHSFSETKDVLLLPVQAPWGSARRAAELAVELKPKYVVPIHDIHWSDQTRAGMYNRFKDSLATYDVTFFEPENNVPFEIDI